MSFGGTNANNLNYSRKCGQIKPDTHEHGSVVIYVEYVS